MLRQLALKLFQSIPPELDGGPHIADADGERVVKRDVVRLAPAPRTREVGKLAVGFADQPVQLLASQVARGHLRSVAPAAGARSCDSGKVVLEQTMSAMHAKILRDIESLGYATSVHRMGEYIELHAV